MTEQTFSADQSGTPASGQGSTFAEGTGDNQPAVAPVGNGLTAEQVTALVTRDEHAQNHIRTLEAETAQHKVAMEALQSQLDKQASVDDLMERLKANDQNQPDKVDLDALVKRATEGVTESLAEQTRKDAEGTNFKKVADAVQAKHGDNADAEMKKLASENGMSFEQLLDMAHTNPTLVLKLSGLKDAAPTTPSLGTGQLQQYNQEPQQARKSVMDMRTTKELVNDYEARLAAKLKELNQA